MRHNPYMAGDPVGKQPSFVGREDVLREALRVLRHPQQNAITLYGQRRIGKTSILQYLEAHLPEKGPYLPVYFDLMNFSGKPLDTLLRELATTIAGAMKTEKPALSRSPQKAFREAWLPAILKGLPDEARLVLLMDEFDVQADPQADKAIKQEFFAYMRALRRLDPKRLKFVFVLGRAIDDLDIVAKGLFKDLPSRRVSLLARKDAGRLIRLSERQDGLRWTDAAVDHIWDLTHGQPYLIQALCNEAWEIAYEESEPPPPVTPEQVDEVVPDAMQRSENMFTWLWEGLGPAEKVVAAALAEAGPVVVDEEQLRRILSESGVSILIRELQNAPQLLQKWDILEPADGGYCFRVELLRRWIAENKPLSRTQDELDRINPVADNLYQAGRGMFESGNPDEAAGFLQQALKLNPSHLGALELAGEIHLLQGDLDAAQETLETLLDLSPGRARARLKQIYLKRAESTEDEEDQLAWYGKILAFYPQDPDATQGKADIAARRRKRYQQSALAEIEELERKQQFAAALEKAQALQKEFPEEKDLAATVERLERKARLGGLHREARDALEQGDPATAIRRLQEIIALEPAYQKGQAAADLYKAVTGEDIPEMKAALENLQQAMKIEKVLSTEGEKQRAALSKEKKNLQAEIQTLQEKVENLQKAMEKQKAVATQIKKQHTSRRLSPWNPLDYLRLLWWSLVTPAQLKAYQEQYRGGSLRAVGNRLAYTLAFLPLFLPALGLGLGLLPRTPEAEFAPTYLWLALGISLIWLFLLALADILEDADGWVFVVAGVMAFVVAGIVAFVVAVGVAVGVAGDVAFVVASVIAFVVAGVVAFVVAGGVAGGVAFGVAVGVAIVVDEDWGKKWWATFLILTLSLGSLGWGIGAALTGASFWSGLWSGIIASIASSAAFGVAVGMASGVDDNIEDARSSRWALMLLTLSLGTLTFFNLGGMVWLQSGSWPIPVWPFLGVPGG